jgi:epoxyqueuosine reductase
VDEFRILTIDSSTLHSYHTTNEVTVAIKAKALELGFDDVGVARVEILQTEGELLREWLAQGYHGAMSYMERNQDKRSDVGLIVPKAKSVIVVAKNYYTPKTHEETSTDGKISRYAWGDDYHDVLRTPLNSLANFIQTVLPESHSKSYVDTGPVIEKSWAVRAGIGWQGKHTNVISKKNGSYFFIGVIITDAELLYDSPVQDFCGSCTACIDACPTAAIEQPYLVNATKCISYWTIEAKADVAIPSEISTRIDGWIYGCDVCQDVCPWNRFKHETDLVEFQPRHNQTSLNLENVLSMTQEEFSSRFKNSPIKRTKLSGLKRNAMSLTAKQETSKA